MRTSIRVPVLAAVVLGLAGCGITGNLRMNRGYAAFASPAAADADRQLGLSLGAVPIWIARKIMHDDPEISAVLRSLKAVRVYIYDVNGDAARVRERIELTRARLLDDGWDAVVAVRDDGEFATALVRMDEPDRIRGLAVMLVDAEEVVLINLIGDIRPETFALVMDEIGLNSLGERVSLTQMSF